ncbi:hypothetical protein HQQ81_13860 [Microbacteriaceae bacterium VKM Ac-2854]|nr:hypothetical protein [Microbacteriaceae bacterium VKM Ac-2854]
MRRIMYDGSSLVTSETVATAVMGYAADVVRLGTSAAVDVPALEANGSILHHTILLGPATQMEIVDIDGEASSVDDSEFPMPSFPALIARAAPVHTAVEDDLMPDLDDELRA